MNAFLMFTSAGPVLALTKFDSLLDPRLAGRLSAFGKFIAYEIPLAQVEKAYAAHYQHLLTDPKYDEEFTVLDIDGKRIYTNIDFKGLGRRVCYEPDRSIV